MNSAFPSNNGRLCKSDVGVMKHLHKELKTAKDAQKKRPAEIVALNQLKTAQARKEELERKQRRTARDAPHSGICLLPTTHGSTARVSSNGMSAELSPGGLAAPMLS